MLHTAFWWVLLTFLTVLHVACFIVLVYCYGPAPVFYFLAHVWFSIVCVCRICLWSHCLYRCFLQMFLCCMSETINLLFLWIWYFVISAFSIILDSVVFAVYGSVSLFCEFYLVYFIVVNVWLFLLVKFKSNVCGWSEFSVLQIGLLYTDEDTDVVLYIIAMSDTIVTSKS